MIPAGQLTVDAVGIQQLDPGPAAKLTDHGCPFGHRGLRRQRRQQLVVLAAGRRLLDVGARARGSRSSHTAAPQPDASASRATSVAMPSERSIMAVATVASSRPSASRGTGSSV